MWRIMHEISCGHLSWKLKDENLRKISPKLRRIFRQPFEINRPRISPEFRSGGLQPQVSASDLF